MGPCCWRAVVREPTGDRRPFDPREVRDAGWPDRDCRKQLAKEGISVKSKRSAPRQHPALRTIRSSLPLLKSYADALGIGAKARGQVHPLFEPQLSFADFLDGDLDDSDEANEVGGAKWNN